MISVKARWEQWCRWNCDLMVINAQKKAFSVVLKALQWRPNHMTILPTTSLWGVAAKWPTRAPKTKLILCLRDPQGYSRISLSLSGKDFERVPEHHVSFKANPMWYSMGCAKLHSLKCSLHKWAWCGTARKSAHLNCINLIHFRLTAGQLHGSSCIVIPGVVCELLQFAATQ